MHDDVLRLDFKSCVTLEGFRCSADFINNSRGLAHFIGDGTWIHSPYMFSPEMQGSPNKMIISRYYTVIMYVLITNIATGNLQKVQIGCEDISLMDSLSRKIIDDIDTVFPFKNYASLLKDESLLQKQILIECLKVTPQDVDLWYTFYDLFPDTVAQEDTFRNILNNGYPDLRLFSKIELDETDQCLIIQLILLLIFMKKYEMARPFLIYVENEAIRSVLQLLGGGA